MLDTLICMASSLVGARMTQIGPSPGPTCDWALMWTMPGSKKESVFPEPVSAIPVDIF